MCGIELGATSRGRSDEEERRCFRPGTNLFVSRNTDVRHVAGQLPQLPGLDAEQSEVAWTQVLAGANESLVDETLVVSSGQLRIPTLEEAIDILSAAAEPVSAPQDLVFTEATAAARRGELDQRSAELRAEIESEALVSRDELVLSQSSRASIQEVIAAAPEAQGSSAGAILDDISIGIQGIETLGELAALITGASEAALSAFTIPAAAVTSIIGGLYGLGDIAVSADRAGIANGYTDALVAYFSENDYFANPSMPRNMASEYRQGWQAAADYLERIRNEDSEQYLRIMSTVRETNRGELFNAIYGEGFHRQ